MYAEKSVIEQQRHNDNDQQMRLVWITQSKAKFQITRWKRLQRIIRIVVRYSPTIVPFVPATLVWNSTAGYHVAEDTHHSYDSGNMSFLRGGVPRRQSKTTGDVLALLSFEIRNLKFPGVEYEFDFDARYRLGDVLNESSYSTLHLFASFT